MHRVLKYLHTSNPIHCSSLHGQLSAGVGERDGVRGWWQRSVYAPVCVCVWERVSVWRVTGPSLGFKDRNPYQSNSPSPSFTLTSRPLPDSSPGLNLSGHLPLLMKIHGFISISGVISETAKHKTGLFPQRPGEPDRMTRLSALAEQGSCRAWKWDLVGGSEVGGSDGEDLMFGLATMAAVCYLSSSLVLMRLSAEMEEKRRGHEEEEKRRTE